MLSESELNERRAWGLVEKATTEEKNISIRWNPRRRQTHRDAAKMGSIWNLGRSSRRLT